MFAMNALTKTTDRIASFKNQLDRNSVRNKIQTRIASLVSEIDEYVASLDADVELLGQQIETPNSVEAVGQSLCEHFATNLRQFKERLLLSSECVNLSKSPNDPLDSRRSQWWLVFKLNAQSKEFQGVDSIIEEINAISFSLEEFFQRYCGQIPHP